MTLAFYRFLAVFILTLISPILCAQSAKKYIKEAQTFIESKQYEQALSALNAALNLEADNANAFHWRGRTNYLLKNYPDAIRDFTAASAGMPKNEELFQDLALANVAAGNHKDAIIAYDKVLALEPKSIEIHNKKAQSQIAVKDFDGAVKTCSNALSINKSDDVSNFYMAVALDSVGNNELAETNYSKALSLIKENKAKKDVPKLHKPYYTGLARVQQKLYKNDLALSNFNEALKIDPNDYELYIQRGKIKVAKLEFQEAILDFNQSIGVNDKNPEAFYQRGLINKKLGQFPAALNDFNQAILLNDRDANTIAGRAACYFAMAKYADAVRDYKNAIALKPDDKEFTKLYTIARDKNYEANKEENAPQIVITKPGAKNNEIDIRRDAETLTIEALITDQSPIKSIVVDTKVIPVKEDEINPTFTQTIQVKGKNNFEIVITDVYLNITKINIKLNKIEVDGPVVSMTKPFESMDNQTTVRELFIENKPNIYFEGVIKDENKIKSIIVNGTSASFPLDMLNPPFQAMVAVGTADTLNVTATDMVGNQSVVRYKLIREDTSGANPMGTTWVVFIENSNYKNLQKLEGPARDVSDMKAALSNYKIDNMIHKKDLSKGQLDKFFSIDLRDMVQKNRVKSIVVWYAGHGKFLNETGYWIPVDGDNYDEYTYYSVNNLRAAIQSYTQVQHVLVISDACESGPAFYMAMRDDAVPRQCGDWEGTKFKSAQVMTSSNKELSSDNSLFTQAFANILTNNPGNCISIESVATKVTGIVKQNLKQTPKFGKIKGLDDQDGSFFFIKKQ
jgi:tetratricopeptide (TPR) repeat protein